jgi:hypothetical protein
MTGCQGLLWGDFVEEAGQQIEADRVARLTAMAECVVADAVVVKPVSAFKFPANREKNRDILKIMAYAAPTN